MAFDNLGKLRNSEVSAPAGQAGAGVTTGAVQQKSVQIDWSKLPSVDNQSDVNKIVDYINTLDKGLSPEEVTAAVREHFGVSTAITDAQLKEYIDLSKQFSAAANSEYQTAETDAAEHVITDEIERLASEYLKENPHVSDNIDDILMSLKTQDPKELSPIGKQLLAELESNNEKKGAISADSVIDQKFTSANLTKNNFIVHPSVLFSPEFRCKTSEAKAEYIMDEYLQKSDPEYAKLTNEADKKAYLKSKQEELKQIMSKLYPELKNADMKNYSMKALVLLQASILEGKPLSEYKNYSKEDLEMVMNSTLEKVVLGFVDKNLSGENVSPEEKLHTMLDTMLSVIDPQYASLSDKEKNEKDIYF